MLSPKFLENIGILCFERRFSKQNSVIRLISDILAFPKFRASYTTVQSYKSGRARAWVCQNISGLHTKLFCNIRSNDFFLSWHRFVVLTAVTPVSEVIVIFLQLILFANTAAFFYSLLGLVSHSFWGGDNGEEIRTRWRCVEKINHSRDSWLVLKRLQAGFSCL